MTDRELLKAAAQAAGLALEEWSLAGPFITVQWKRGLTNSQVWNPLTDDGDALRLAVKLGLTVDGHGMFSRVGLPFQDEPLSHECHNGDPYAATRRAIVRAAAAMAVG